MGLEQSSSFHTKSACTIVSVEGNIGSGKTTGIAKLKQYIIRKKSMD